jgi:superfamily II DNA or RNA helicase
MLSNYYQFLQKAINYTKKDKYTLEELIQKYNSLSSNELWKIFEFYCCMKNDIIHWDYLPFEIKDWLYENYKITRDYGIDGLSEDKKISLQCKFRNNTNITYTEISTFFTLSSLLKCEKLLLSTLNNAKISEMADNMINNLNITTQKLDKDTFIQDISKDIFNNYEEIILKSENKEEIKLRNYQIEAIDIFINNVKNNIKTTNIQITCAGGKSVMIKYFIREFKKAKKVSKESKKSKGINILILVPIILLAEEMADKLKEYKPIIYHSKIKIENTDSNIHICLYNSIHKLVKKIKHFDLVIIDEGHHLDKSVDKDTYRKTIQNLNADFKLNLSATFHEGVELHFNYKIEDGIKDGFINDYDIIVPWFIEEEIKEEKKEEIELIFEGVNDNKSNKSNKTIKRLQLQPQVFKSLKNLLQKRIDFMWVLAYCNNIPESKLFVKFLNENGISAVHMDGTMNIEKRIEILGKFERGKYRVLSSVSILGEGINLVYVDTVMFVSPRYSFINIVQCIGRCQRLKKHISHVIFPHIAEDLALEKF